MRISDWSSDLCSSDLHHIADHDVEPQLAGLARDRQPLGQPAALVELDVDDIEAADKRGRVGERQCAFVSSEERRVGKECVSTCRSRGSPVNNKKNKNDKNE